MGPPARGGPTDPSHDEELRRGILRTDVSRPVAALLTGAFLAIAFTVPLVQAIMERVKGDDSVLPDLFTHWPTQESIKQFEEDLDKASYAREAVRPRLQYALTRYGGFGNTKAVVGRDGWLFYQPGVAAVGGPGLLEPAILESRVKAAHDSGSDQLHPDPRPAILDFATFLAERGVKLVLFPIPDKAGIQPAQLHGRVDGERGTSPGRNPDQGQLFAELQSAGVLIFDPTPARLDENTPPRFLVQDTHWTPEWMEEVARTLAGVLSASVKFDAPPNAARWTVVPKEVSRVGDIVDMLGLPPGQTLFRPQTVTVRQVHDASGALFEGRPDAEVLLLGDSFCNVFTLGQMGWGEAAGLAPQLARFLEREVDVIAQNDSGAFATRQLLWNELSGGDPKDPRPDRLTGKKVVVWEFASRELAVGNWRPLRWPRGTSRTAPVARPGAGPTPREIPR